jgi:hypothetical protein
MNEILQNSGTIEPLVRTVESALQENGYALQSLIIRSVCNGSQFRFQMNCASRERRSWRNATGIQEYQKVSNGILEAIKKELDTLGYTSCGVSVSSILGDNGINLDFQVGQSPELYRSADKQGEGRFPDCRFVVGPQQVSSPQARYCNTGTLPSGSDA